MGRRFDRATHLHRTMNIHTPERQQGESFEAYKQRRAASKAAARQILRGGEQRQPARIATDANGRATETTDPRGYWLGQHHNPAKNAQRKAKRTMGARWYRNAVKAARRVGAKT
jgi:hypothetical protein